MLLLISKTHSAEDAFQVNSKIHYYLMIFHKESGKNINNILIICFSLEVKIQLWCCYDKICRYHFNINHRLDKRLTCVEVLAGFVGVHGGMANRRLHCPLWLDYTSAGKKLVDGRAEVCDLGGFQGPIVQLRLSHTLS